MNKLEVQYIPVKDLQVYKHNAKQHPKWQVKKIAESIEKFGFNDPIAVDENNVIIEGHGRYLAAQELGKKKVPCIVLEGLTRAQKKAYIIAHNKLNMDTGFDIEELRRELKSIDMDELNIDFLDFDSSLLSDDLDVNDEDFIQGNEYVKKKYTIKIECNSEKQMEKRKAKLRKAGWI